MNFYELPPVKGDTVYSVVLTIVVPGALTACPQGHQKRIRQDNFSLHVSMLTELPAVCKSGESLTS